VTSLNILSGGAAQGLVGSLAADFKTRTGFDIGGEFLRARHRAAELGDPVAGYADVSDFPVTGRDHGRAAYNEVEAHRSIVAGGYQTGEASGLIAGFDAIGGGSADESSVPAVCWPTRLV